MNTSAKSRSTHTGWCVFLGGRYETVDEGISSKESDGGGFQPAGNEPPKTLSEKRPVRTEDEHWAVAREAATLADGCWGLSAGYLAHILEESDLHFYCVEGRPVVLLTRDIKFGDSCTIRGETELPPYEYAEEIIRQVRAIGGDEDSLYAMLSPTPIPDRHCSVTPAWVRRAGLAYTEIPEGMVIEGNLTLEKHCLLARFGGEATPCFESIVAIQGTLTLSDCELGHQGSLRRVGALEIKGRTLLKFSKSLTVTGI